MRAPLTPLAQTLSRFWPLPLSDDRALPPGTWSPDIDCFDRGQTFLVRVDLPGTALRDIHVEVSEDQLTIFGERRREVHERGDHWSHAERAYGWFSRVIELPAAASPDDVTATLHQGVLEVRVPIGAAEIVDAAYPHAERKIVQVRRGFTATQRCGRRVFTT